MRTQCQTSGIRYIQPMFPTNPASDATSDHHHFSSSNRFIILKWANDYQIRVSREAGESFMLSSDGATSAFFCWTLWRSVLWVLSCRDELDWRIRSMGWGFWFWKGRMRVDWSRSWAAVSFSLEDDGGWRLQRKVLGSWNVPPNINLSFNIRHLPFRSFDGYLLFLMHFLKKPRSSIPVGSRTYDNHKIWSEVSWSPQWSTPWVIRIPPSSSCPPLQSFSPKPQNQCFIEILFISAAFLLQAFSSRVILLWWVFDARPLLSISTFIQNHVSLSFSLLFLVIFVFAFGQESLELRLLCGT